MVIFANDLGRGEFKDVSYMDWDAWWRSHEVDPQREIPGGPRLPVSKRVRQTLRPGEAPPPTGLEWQELQEAREREAIGWPPLPARVAITTTATAAAAPVRASVWQKLARVAFGDKGGKGRTKAPKG
jgi:hypothetical protein